MTVLDYLDDCERWLIEQHFFNDIPRTEIARIHGVNQSSISRQIGKILEKLKILILTYSAYKGMVESRIVPYFKDLDLCVKT